MFIRQLALGTSTDIFCLFINILIHRMSPHCELIFFSAFAGVEASVSDSIKSGLLSVTRLFMNHRKHVHFPICVKGSLGDGWGPLLEKCSGIQMKIVQCKAFLVVKYLPELGEKRPIMLGNGLPSLIFFRTTPRQIKISWSLLGG